MVNLRLTDTFVSTNPAVVAAGNHFILSLGNDKTMVPSISRSLATPEMAIRNGSPFQINLQPGCDFSIDDVIFENIVKNASGGGSSEFLNRLLHYVNTSVVQVSQDSAAPLTAKQILAYTAP